MVKRDRVCDGRFFKRFGAAKLMRFPRPFPPDVKRALCGLHCFSSGRDRNLFVVTKILCGEDPPICLNIGLNWPPFDRFEHLRPACKLHSRCHAFPGCRPFVAPGDTRLATAIDFSGENTMVPCNASTELHSRPV
jgi:hypothetical protein